MTSSVSWVTFMVVGANRMPAAAASTMPRIHAIPDTRPADAPESWASWGSSTTARMAMPVRVRVKSTRNPMATSKVRPTVRSCS